MGSRRGEGNSGVSMINKLQRQSKIRTFQVVETGRGIQNSSIMSMTEKEMSAYLKTRQENLGYVPGLGGDRTYAINAWTIGKDGYGYVDMEDIWKRYRRKGKK